MCPKAMDYFAPIPTCIDYLVRLSECAIFGCSVAGYATTDQHVDMANDIMARAVPSSVESCAPLQCEVFDLWWVGLSSIERSVSFLKQSLNVLEYSEYNVVV